MRVTARRDRPAVVAVAMSGGVDSSVAAALCVAAGFQVRGLMLRLWSEPGGRPNRCCSWRAVDDAAMVAAALKIPFELIDAREEFRHTVVDRFLRDSAASDTPNPCFTCNRRLRFGFLLTQARARGADYLATGHYARVARLNGRWQLLRAVDTTKDQSYVLHRLGQAELAHVQFPVGGYTKAEVRALARRFDLPVASRPDSVDLCWLGDDGVAGFLRRHLPPAALRPGPIEDQAGRVLGQHQGLALYTVGQRHGLGVAAGVPLYVLRRDVTRNALIVGPAEALFRRTVWVREMHWVDRVPEEPLRIEAQVRYRAPAAPATIEALPDDRAVVHFDQPQRAPTPGQGLVVYRGEVCLGGGRIEAAGEGDGPGHLT